MKVLTVKQPWATLIVRGIKDVENRDWKSYYRGRILIHSSKTVDWEGRCAERCFTRAQWESIPDPTVGQLLRGDWQDWPRGCIVGNADFVGMDGTRSVWASPNALWHWALRDQHEFRVPIPARGMPGLWNYDTDTLHVFVQRD